MITDGENPIELDEWETTARKMDSLDIIATIMYVFRNFFLLWCFRTNRCHSGIDFDDEEFGYEEEDKSDIKVDIHFCGAITSLKCEASAKTKSSSTSLPRN